MRVAPIHNRPRLGSAARHADPIALILSTLMVMISGLGLQAADWTDHLVIVPAVGVLGVIAGAALGASRFRARAASFFALVYGAFAVGWRLGGVLETGLIWRDRILELGLRIGSFVGVVWRGQGNQDPLMFVLLMAGMYWVMGTYAGWVVVRRLGLWGATLPSGLTLMVNAFYYVGEAPLEWHLGSYVLLTLLLALRLNLVWRREIWRRINAQVPPSAVPSIHRVGLVTALLLVGLAWGVPAFAQSEMAARLWADVTKPWGELRERLHDAFGNLRSPLVRVSDYYASSLTLGAGAEPADTLVMFVEPDHRIEDRGRFYWRSRVYDTYQDGEWSSTIVQGEPFDPESGDWPPSQYAGRELHEFSITLEVPALRVLYVPAQPVWVSRPSDVASIHLPDGGLDILSVAADPVVIEGEGYRARASVAVPTADELRDAGTDYPAWITERFLRLPDSITQRTQDLARAIVAGIESPYDQAAAVTRWLRSNIRYSRVTDAPPSDVEPIDWFLFDYRVGFCNYYASAEVILLRSLGIPARLSAGFAAGSYDARTGRYEVRGGDAHAWPEVFFPGIGWVEFEPTASQAPLIRVEVGTREGGTGAGGTGENQGGIPSEGRFEQEFFGVPTPEPAAAEGGGRERGAWPVGWILAIVGTAMVGVAIWLWADPYSKAVVLSSLATRLRRLGLEPPGALGRTRLQAETTAGQFYLRWSLWLGRLGLPLVSAQTPYERADLFSAKLPAGRDAAWTIVEQYSGERFGGLPADEIAVRRAWNDLRLSLWLAWGNRLLAPLREQTRQASQGGTA